MKIQSIKVYLIGSFLIFVYPVFTGNLYAHGISNSARLLQTARSATKISENIKKTNEQLDKAKKTSESLQSITSAPEKLFALGMRYLNGDGVSENKKTGAIFIRQAAEQGLVKAQATLAKCYMEGAGVEKDKNEAIKWYRKAADQGDKESKEALKRLGY